MKSPAVLAIVSVTALLLAAGVFYAPKTITSMIQPQTQTEEVKIKAKAKREKKLKYSGEVDASYIDAFRKCNSGMKEYCDDSKHNQPDGQPGAVDPEKLVTSLAGGMKAPVHPPVVFNELMVRTALKFAAKKSECRRPPCGNDPEQHRIFTKIFKEAHTGCSRRQLAACLIEGDLLAAEKKFTEARDVMQSSAKVARTVLSRCDGGTEPDQAVCQESRSQLETFNAKSKFFYEAMLQSH